MQAKRKTPVTILTGFLGSGKTTLLNHILSESHGLKLAVIENQFGEVGVDEHLVKQSLKVDEQIVEALNGCICCTVRGDLAKIIKRLLIQEKRVLDGIIIETTGMADPSPVAQTFFLDEDVASTTTLDGIITVISAKHILQHLREKRGDNITNESIQQIAFADRIIINKIDLISPEYLSQVISEVRAINQFADIMQTQYSKVHPSKLLGLQAFKLDKVLKWNPNFLPNQQKKEHDHHQHQHHEGCQHCPHSQNHQHHKQTQKMTAQAPQQLPKKNHIHDTSVSSCGCIIDEPINLSELNRWISQLISQKSNDLYRYKGIINVKGRNMPYVFQGVHQIFDGHFVKNGWKESQSKQTRFCFIGKNLDKQHLINSFKKCIAKQLTLKVGNIILIRDRNNKWSDGIVTELWANGLPYVVKMRNGRTINCPVDDPNLIKLKVQLNQTGWKGDKLKVLKEIEEIKLLGSQLFSKKQYESAIIAYKRGFQLLQQSAVNILQLELDGLDEYFKICKNIAICFLRLHNYEDSVEFARFVTKSAYYDQQALYILGKAFMGLEEYQQALEYLKRAEELSDEEIISRDLKDCQMKLKIEQKEREDKRKMNK